MNEKYQIGDVVICINDKDIKSGNLPKPIKEGLKYIINDIHTCATCGMVEFEISVPYDGNGLACRACGTSIGVKCNFWYMEHWRFKKEEKKEEHNINVSFKTKEIVKDIEKISN